MLGKAQYSPGRHLQRKRPEDLDLRLLQEVKTNQDPSDWRQENWRILPLLTNPFDTLYGQKSRGLQQVRTKRNTKDMAATVAKTPRNAGISHNDAHNRSAMTSLPGD